MLIVISTVGCIHDNSVYAMYKINVSIFTFRVLWLLFCLKTVSIRRKSKILPRQYMILSAFKYEKLAGWFSRTFPVSTLTCAILETLGHCVLCV